MAKLITDYKLSDKNRSMLIACRNIKAYVL
ncbi:hypothetical protein SAMN05216286_3579 [Kosakonia oryzae]|uniref:Uncharacterized protein n=1 Tax=Kosakonia oryzae TaxID=497725 RepID=A0AA94KR49_9ENTR|nr:hypothetical protein SAMN05216286_3579 [Kosakonia oryzae]